MRRTNLIYGPKSIYHLCKKWCAEANMKTEWIRLERRFNGELRLTQCTRERQREREREKTQKTLFQNNALTQCTCVCSINTFYTSPRRTDRSTIVLQCSLRAPTLTPKIYSSRFSTQNWPNRSVPTNPVLDFSRSGRCWACLSTILNMIVS